MNEHLSPPSLTVRERRRLGMIEADLARSAPELAAAFDAFDSCDDGRVSGRLAPAPAAASVAGIVVGIVVGFAAIVAGLVWRAPIVGFAGFVAALVSTDQLLATWAERLAAALRSDDTGETDGPA